MQTVNLLVSYDVNTEDAAGRKRLRMVAKACAAFGQRVQYSVFECDISETDLVRLRQRLLKVVDEDRDSLRIYRLRGRREEVVESYGRDTYVDYWGPLVL